MECKERERLAQEYLNALQEQRKVTATVEELQAAGKPDLVAFAQKQVEAVIDECYEAWRAFNEHHYSHQCSG